MKLLILCALAAAVAADGDTRSYPQPAAQHAVQPAARSGSIAYSAKPDYNYAYSVKDPYSGVDIDAQENRYGYQTQGAYGSSLPDGRRQNVNYLVDGDSGYQANVEYYGVAQHPRTPINAYNRRSDHIGGNHISRSSSFGKGRFLNGGYGHRGFNRGLYGHNNFGYNGLNNYGYSGLNNFGIRGLGHYGFSGLNNYRFGGLNNYRYNGLGRYGFGGLNNYGYSGLGRYGFGGLNNYRYNGFGRYGFGGLNNFGYSGLGRYGFGGLNNYGSSGILGGRRPFRGGYYGRGFGHLLRGLYRRGPFQNDYDYDYDYDLDFDFDY